jgi:hypothetical protein
LNACRIFSGRCEKNLNKNIKNKHEKRNSKVAVLTEEGNLNLHAFDLNLTAVMMQRREADQESEAVEVLLSQIYDLEAISWQVIKRINLKF